MVLYLLWPKSQSSRTMMDDSSPWRAHFPTNRTVRSLAGNQMLGFVPTLYTTSRAVAATMSPESRSSRSSGVVIQPSFSRKCSPTRLTVYGCVLGANSQRAEWRLYA